MNLWPSKSKAAERYRQYRTSGNGKIEVYLPPSRSEDLRVKLAEAAKVRDTKIDRAAELHSQAVSLAKSEHARRIKELDSNNRKAVADADREFDEIEAKLLAEYAAPLSQEQIALLTTPVGGTVRIAPAAPAKIAEVANAPA